MGKYITILSLQTEVYGQGNVNLCFSCMVSVSYRLASVKTFKIGFSTIG